MSDHHKEHDEEKTAEPVEPPEQEPDTAEGPPPSQDDPVAPGGTIPPRAGSDAG